jgi:cytidylate kinase
MNTLTTSQRLVEAMERAERHWQTSGRSGPAAAPAAPISTGLTIAISRQAGTHGPAIARAVSERLHWPVYDRELLEQIGGEMGMRARLLESVDEKHVGWLHECLQSFHSTPGVSASGFVHRLVEMLLSMAAHGECVIVGRGAAQVLPAGRTLRVRLVAPLADRVEAVRVERGISREEAVRWIANTDAERSQFVLNHFHKDPADPSLYDLVLNPARLSPAGCADLIVAALHCRKAVLAAPRAEAVPV